MIKFLVFLNRLVNLYLYYVVMACFLSLVPFINPNYPLFNFIFQSAGFYIIPPIFGFYFGPAVVLVILVLLSKQVKEVCDKIIKKQPKIIVLSAKDFVNAMENKDEFIKSLKEDDEGEDKQ